LKAIAESSRARFVRVAVAGVTARREALPRNRSWSQPTANQTQIEWPSKPAKRSRPMTDS
jgi:hypothetical protein